MKAKLFALGLFALICGPALFSPASLFPQNIDLDLAQAQEDFRLGVQAFHHGYLQEAVLYFQKALSLKPDTEPYRRWLGRALYRSGLEDAALREWRSLLDAGRGDALLRDTVQRVELRRGLGRELRREQELPDEKRWVVAQEVPGPFRRPSSVRLRPDGSALIVSFAGNEVVHVDVNNAVLETWQGGLGGFDRPYDVVEEGGSVFVSEYGANRIARLSSAGQRQGAFGKTGSGPGELLGPQYLAADGRGHLFVSDWGNHRVNKYDFDGSFLLSFGGRAGAGPELAGPTGIAVAGETVFVADKPAARIEVYDLSGNHLRTLRSPLLAAPEGLSLLDGATLLAADGSRILKYDIERELWTVLADFASSSRRLTSVEPGPNGEIYAADFDLGRLFILAEAASLYSGMFVQVERVSSDSFPLVQVEVSVLDRTGRPVVGLEERNFRLLESSAPVGGTALVQRVPPELEIAVVVDPSVGRGPYGRSVREAVAALYDGLARQGKLRVIGAGERPAVEADERSSRLEVLEGAERAAGVGVAAGAGSAAGGRLDLAIRLAAAQILPAHARRTVVLLTAGGPGREAFRDYSPGETARYLANNGIAFHAVTFGASPRAEELSFLAGETGGAVWSWLAPAGLNPLVERISGDRRPLYTLQYTSRSPGRFGEVYIPLEVQAALSRRSGRDESGYYAPRGER